MANLIPRHAGFVCRSCRSTRTPQSIFRAYATASDRPRTLRQQLSKGGALPPRAATATKSPARTDSNENAARNAQDELLEFTKSKAKARKSTTSDKKQQLVSIPINASDPPGVLQKIQNGVEEIGRSEHIPEELKVAELLDQAYQFSNLLIFGQTEAPDEAESKPVEKQNTGNPLLSDLDEASVTRVSTSSQPIPAEMSMSYREAAALSLCKAIHQLLKDPKIYITIPLLTPFVQITCLLGHPEYLPEIFYLYAHKEIPQPRTFPIRYRKPFSTAPKYAIPRELSDIAIEAAILRKDMPLCISVIDTTVGTRQFRLNRLITRGGLPILAASTTPAIAWAASDWASHYQNSWPPELFFKMCMWGAAAYVGTLGYIGWIAIATWNDHHKRVRWVRGTPFRFRWLHEPERLYLDKVAMAWGYKKPEMWGEEAGEEWESLREMLAARWMVLDLSELLPGML